jgi:hypothetical protein
MLIAMQNPAPQARPLGMILDSRNHALGTGSAHPLGPGDEGFHGQRGGIDARGEDANGETRSPSTPAWAKPLRARVSEMPSTNLATLFEVARPTTSV